MFELADYLVGIYKVHDCTNSVTIKNYDKQRVLNLGEKASEKENQNENLTVVNEDSMASCRASQMTAKESDIFEASAVSQPMETEG